MESTASRRLAKNASIVRLDGVDHPYGNAPISLAAREARAAGLSAGDVARLRSRLNETFRVPIDCIVLMPRIDDVIRAIARKAAGPIVALAPSAHPYLVPDGDNGHPTVWLARGQGRASAITCDMAADLPADGVAIVGSPCDPLGSLLATADAVRLARACRYLVIDERFVEFAGRSSLAFAAEFDNIVVLRSFEFWAGLHDPPCAWAIIAPQVASELGLAGPDPDPAAIAAAVATLDDLPSVEATLRLVREERSRLFRCLRKFSFLEPLPSWGPFVSARVAMVPRTAVLSGLASRGIHVHAPPQPGLEQFIRIGIGSPSAMNRLRDGLRDLAPELFADDATWPLPRSEPPPVARQTAHANPAWPDRGGRRERGG